MPTAPPTPAELLGMLGDFFFGFWLGQALTGAALVAVLAGIIKPFRLRLKALGSRLRARIEDIQITRRSTTARKIQDAVESAVAEVRAELAPAAQPADSWSTPTAISEEDRQLARDEANHQANIRDQWSLSTYRSRKHGFVLHNHAAGAAENVRLDGAHGFEFLDDAEWDLIPQGKFAYFAGRVVDADEWRMLDRKMDVHWVDDHGDAQVKRIQVDRTLRKSDY